MENERKINSKVGILIVVFVAVIALVVIIYGQPESSSDDINMEYLNKTDKKYSSDDCNVLVFPVIDYLDTYAYESLEGYIITSSEDIVYNIDQSEDNPQIKAVIMSIDSSGGSGVAGEEIANALKRFSKPSVAVIRGMGASASYFVATGADKIFASKISEVGSIGVTMSYLDQTEKDAKEGYKYIELTSAKYKDLGYESRPISEEEKQILLADLKKDHDLFVEDVAQNRNLKVEDVAKLANGLTFLGIDALSYGLIDEIGDLHSATEYLESLIGEPVELCRY